MAVTLYQSTDASAPVLTGAAGSLIALLDACLVNGYGSQPSAGWTKPFTGTNLAAYKSPSTTNPHYYAIDDTTTAQPSPSLKGFETMSNVSTGTVQFGGTTLNLLRSATTDATARPWMLLTNGKTVWLLVNTTSSATWTNGAWFGFGEFVSDYSSIQNCCSFVMGNTSATQVNLFAGLGNAISSAASGLAVNRLGAGTVAGSGAVRRYCLGTYGVNMAVMGAPTFSSGGYPHPVTGGIPLAQIGISEVSTPYIERGYFPGIWVMTASPQLAYGSTFTGRGALSGKTFLVVSGMNDSGTASGAQIILETSNTW